MQANSYNYTIGQVFFYGNKKVMLLDARPQLFYAKIRYLENDKEAAINIRALSKYKKKTKTLSLGLFCREDKNDS